MAKKKTISLKKTARTSKNTARHPKHFLNVYWPYIPIIALVVFGVFFGGVNPAARTQSPATLAYATEMSVNGLLSATNAERASNNLPPLTLNSKLNQSAQAKANDMLARDYWAHNTPDGQEPWIFFDAAGYEYQKAGENLAYGFSSSETTVIGWMNSPSHRANVLDDTYTEVGFGFINAENFVSTGQETIVVAHYAKPPVVVATAPTTPQAQSSPQALPATEIKPVDSANKSTTESQSELTPSVQDTLVPDASASESAKNLPVTTETPIDQNKQSTVITRMQKLTGGKAPWSAVAVTAVAFIVVMAWLVKHAFLVKRFIVQGEHFVAHHPVFDLVVISVAALAIYLSQASGIVL